MMMAKSAASLFRLSLVIVGMISTATCFYFVCLSLFQFDGAFGVAKDEGGFGTSLQSALKRNAKDHITGLNWKRQIVASNDLKNRWGSLRPGIYFGMKTTTSPISFTTGLMWNAGSGQKFRHKTNQDELKSFDWIVHNGKSYGKELLCDDELKVNLQASFLAHDDQREDASNVDDLTMKLAWSQRFEIEQQSPKSNSSHLVSVVFYMGFETTSLDVFQALTESGKVLSNINLIRSGNGRDDKKKVGAEECLSVVGLSADSGWFCLDMCLEKSLDTEFDDEGDKSTLNSLSFVGFSGTDSITGAETLQQAYQHQPPADRRRLHANVYKQNGEFSNSMDPASSFVAVQARSTKPFVLKASLFEHIEVGSIAELIALVEKEPLSTKLDPKFVSNEMARQEAAFHTKFQEIYRLSSGDSTRTERTSTSTSSADTGSFSPADVVVAKRALSAVLGGIGFFHGQPVIGHGLEVDQEGVPVTLAPTGPPIPPPGPGDVLTPEQQAQQAQRLNQHRQEQREKFEGEAWPSLNLLSATPSRTSFPRGFLWDEGFHQLLISTWDIPLSLSILSHWLGCQYLYERPSGGGGVGKRSALEDEEARVLGGWIPREMILGDDARGRVPDEFVTQRVNIANPPTLLLVIDALLDRLAASEQSGEDDGGVEGHSRGIDTIEQKCSSSVEAIEAGRQECENPPASGPSPSSTSSASSSRVRERKAAHVSSTDAEAILKFLKNNYGALDSWVRWFLHSQKGPESVSGSFRWRGRSTTDTKVLPNTLASGLDDYPRAPLPSTDEYHVDLLCWIIKATSIMAKVEKLLIDKGLMSSSATPITEKAEATGVEKDVGGGDGATLEISEPRGPGSSYAALSQELLESLVSLHWSSEDSTYLDVGLYNRSSGLVTEIIIRCQRPVDSAMVDAAVNVELIDRAQDKSSLCPPGFPTLLFPHRNSDGTLAIRERFVSGTLSLTHVPRKGYVSLFPLLLRLEPANSPRLSALLDLVEDPALLWTPYGLRSLAANDTFYQRRNAPGDAPYWRGYIWININYLALVALKFYSSVEGPQGQRAEKLYTQLRSNIQRNILSEYHRTGYFWEQYDDSTGQGIRGHPFTGWTTLLLNIMAEMY